ncbi:MAG: sodium:solute symporter, partial [Acidobacteria bacterium]|nr:sodium:solute symporter [Acidobacteriota bacterium]
MTFELAAILAYIVVQLVIGGLVARRVTTQADFLLAGRSLGPLLGTFTVFATWFGAETCLSSAGSAVSDGVSLASVEPFGYGFCLVLMGAVFAAPLWRRGLTTLGDLFAQRFSPRVERLATLVIVPSSVLWAGAQIRGFGQVLASVSALDVATAITLAAAVVMLYTALGGMLADAITDTLQGVILIVGLVALLVAVVVSQGGAVAAASVVDTARVSLFGAVDSSALDLIEAWAIPICGSALAQELVSRALAMRSPELARRATLAGASLYIAVGTIPVVLGLMAPALPGR